MTDKETLNLKLSTYGVPLKFEDMACSNEYEANAVMVRRAFEAGEEITEQQEKKAWAWVYQFEGYEEAAKLAANDGCIGETIVKASKRDPEGLQRVLAAQARWLGNTN